MARRADARKRPSRTVAIAAVRRRTNARTVIAFKGALYRTRIKVSVTL